MKKADITFNCSIGQESQNSGVAHQRMRRNNDYSGLLQLVPKS
jgi:hypothetical protein